MAQKPSIPKGTRDFGPLESSRRDYIFGTVKSVFKKYGYSQIETPAMENLSTLLGKYGEEGDKLLFKILNSGDAFAQVDPAMLSNSNSLSLKICEKGLRYDLTVPFARFVVQHFSELTFPFKRYQIQPVWRADRPQKGRYREFYQCDIDVVGSNSQLNELELMLIVDEVFKNFELPVLIKFNNRKILSAIAEIMESEDKITDITTAIDKIDKVGLDEVKRELIERGIPATAIDKLVPILELKGNNREKLQKISQIISTTQIGKLAIDEVEELLSLIENSGIESSIELDLSLARGLSYYTGAIFEVKAVGVDMGSICGGGRYDNLTGIFGMPGLSGVGISFGADRIYDVLLSEGKFPNTTSESVKILFSNMGKSEVAFSLSIIKELRKRGISCEIYPDETKLKKQFDYATKKGITYFAIVGESEVANNSITLKNLESGNQESLTKVQCVDFFGD